MKNFILTLLSATIAVASFAQTEPYGPVPYKTLEQTIGETYVLTQLFPGTTFGYDLKKADGNPATTNDFGKSLKLISLDREKSIAYLKDSLGLVYTDDIIKDKIMWNLILQSDLNEARKLFLNKTLWLNVTTINEGRYRVKGNFKEISCLRFEPVTITDISPGYVDGRPLLFTMKTKSGQYGNLDLGVSGTNSDLDSKDSFGTHFLTEDPKLKYHFTPAVWKMVQAGYTEIGMPMDAFKLVMGLPDKINSTQTAKGTTQQWIYGTSYYYFAGGKLTAKQN